MDNFGGFKVTSLVVTLGVRQKIISRTTPYLSVPSFLDWPSHALIEVNTCPLAIAVDMGKKDPFHLFQLLWGNKHRCVHDKP